MHRCPARIRRRQRTKDELPLLLDRSRLRKALDRWLEVDSDQAAGDNARAKIEDAATETPEAREVAARAKECRRRLEDEARKAEDRFLFHRSDVSIAPVEIAVMRLAGKMNTFGLVGCGEPAQEVMPSFRLHRTKFLGWLGLGFLGLNYLEILETPALARPLLERVKYMRDVYDQSLMTISILSDFLVLMIGLLVIAGVRRIFRPKRKVQTIGLIAAAGGPTAFLTCLAYLGSYLGHLKVLDRDYDTQTEQLRGKAREQRQSGNLSIELGDGRKVRLIEVAEANRLSNDQIRHMTQALDGMIFLERPGEAMEELQARISGIADVSPRIGSISINASRDLDLANDALPLGAIQRLFVEDLRDDVDWQSLFHRMWRPLKELLID